MHCSQRTETETERQRDRETERDRQARRSGGGSPGQVRQAGKVSGLPRGPPSGARGDGAAAAPRTDGRAAEFAEVAGIFPLDVDFA